MSTTALELPTEVKEECKSPLRKEEEDMESRDKETASISVKEEEAKESSAVKEEEKKDEPPPKIDFNCSICKLINVKCDYFGRRPPFARRLQLTEDSFVMKDPFSPPPSAGRPNAEYFLIVGVKCAMCEAEVCKASECSVHYSRTFCRPCALDNIKQFPIEVQTKFRKQLNTQNT